MNLLVVGCSYRTTPVEVREKLAFAEDRVAHALAFLTERLQCEAVILNTCNRVELYLGRIGSAAAALEAETAARLVAEYHGLAFDEIRPHLYVHEQQAAVRHLFRVAASLDSLIVGEGQIAGQVKKAYESAQECDSIGAAAPRPHSRRRRQVARRVRTDTGISRGHVSVSSVRSITSGRYSTISATRRFSSSARARWAS